MRIPKHRTWDNVNKRFTDSVNTYIDTEGNLYADCDPHGVDMSGRRIINHRPQYEFAGMSTGMVDSKGNLLYEGDIVLREINVGLPSYLYGMFQIYFGVWCYMRASDKERENSFGFDAIDARSNCVLVGNIFQHAELLK